MSKKQKKVLWRILIAAALLVLLLLLPLTGWLRFALFLIPYFVIGYDILIKAFKGIVNRQPFDENFLMAVATVGAIALGEYTEGVAVMLFYQIGELFQSYAVGRSRRSIAALMDIRPDSANLLGEDGEITARWTLPPSPARVSPARSAPAARSSAAASTSARRFRSAPAASSANPPCPRSWIWWRTPPPASPNRRTSFPALPAYIPRLCATAHSRWLFCRRW